MAIPVDIANALYGTWRLAHLDRGGLAFFGRDETAFWRSFRAALIVYPAILFYLLQPLVTGDGEGAAPDVLRAVLVETIGYVIIWVAFPLVILPVTRFLGREARWLDFIIVYNWSQVLQNGVILAVVAASLTGVVPGLLAGIALYCAYAAAFAYECFIARIVLDIPWPAALMIGLVDLVLSRLVTLTAESMH